MSVKNQHTQYSLMTSEWAKCEDFTTSEKAVHDKGEDYLDKLAEMTTDEYTLYKSRAPLLLYAQRAVKAMVGMIMRKEPYITNSDKIQDLLSSIDAEGNDFSTYCSKLIYRFLVKGREATLVDMPKSTEGMTVLQLEQLGIQPRFIRYPAEDIINWRTKKVGNQIKLVMVVLREDYDDVEDEFTWTTQSRYRVITLENDRVYRQRLYDENENVIDDVVPKMKRQFINILPISIHGGVEVQQPPMLSVIDLNKHHYKLSADEIHGLRMCALPTPYFFGEDPKEKEFPSHIGPTRMIGHSDTDCKIGFLEFNGLGMAAVASKLQKYEDSIVMFSVQMADSPNETATGSSIDYGNATATLAGISDILSRELTYVLQIAARWNRDAEYDSYKVQLNKDFIPAGMGAQKLLALLQAYVSGTISYNTYYNELAKGEITDPNQDPKKELEQIKVDLPMLKEMLALGNVDASSQNNPADGGNTE